MSRNNSVGQHWAPGVLYHEAGQAKVVQLDFVEMTAMPDGPGCATVLQVQAAFLQRAVAAHGLSWQEIAKAELRVRFDVAEQPGRKLTDGEPFEVMFAIADNNGKVAAVVGRGHCWRQAVSVLER